MLLTAVAALLEVHMLVVAIQARLQLKLQVEEDNNHKKSQRAPFQLSVEEVSLWDLTLKAIDHHQHQLLYHQCLEEAQRPKISP